MVRKLFSILFISLIVCVGCQMKFQGQDEEESSLVRIERYDRLEYRYLTTADYSALQEMNTEYPMETRTLLEDVLQIGDATDPDINSKFINFYQDTRLQSLINDAETHFANMDSLNSQFNKTFIKLKKLLPNLKIPRIYAQLTALDQSVVVGNQTIGISLDKYLGENYAGYTPYYPPEQRRMMSEEYIVPDCIVFYLLSQYPLKHSEARSQIERDMQLAKIQWVANQALSNNFFKGENIEKVGVYMKKNHKLSTEELLQQDNLSIITSE